MRISDWSSDVCSSDLPVVELGDDRFVVEVVLRRGGRDAPLEAAAVPRVGPGLGQRVAAAVGAHDVPCEHQHRDRDGERTDGGDHVPEVRSEEHTSELQSLMRISYAVFCLKKKKATQHSAIRGPQTYPPRTHITTPADATHRETHR